MYPERPRVRTVLVCIGSKIVSKHDEQILYLSHVCIAVVTPALDRVHEVNLHILSDRFAS